MSLRRLVLALVCGGLAAGMPAPALAQKGPGAAGSEIVIRVCNNTNDNARVAVSYQPVGGSQFYNEGWYGVRPVDFEGDVVHDFVCLLFPDEVTAEVREQLAHGTVLVDRDGRVVEP